MWVMRDSRYVINYLPELQIRTILYTCNDTRIAMPPIKNLKMVISISQTRHGDTARDGPLALGSIIIGIL